MSRLIACAREREVIAAVAAGRWAAADDDLRDHVARCQACAEARGMAETMRALEHETLDEVRLPSGAQVWWRAQLRARREAQQAAARPVLVAQGLGAAVVIGLIAAVLSWQWPVITEVAGAWMRQPLVSLDLGVTAWAMLVVAAVAGPLAIYWAVARE